MPPKRGLDGACPPKIFDDAAGGEKALNMFMLGLGVAAPGVGKVIEAVFPNENWGVNPELLLGGLMFKKAAPPNPEDWVVDEVLDSPSVFAAPKENADFPK